MGWRDGWTFYRAAARTVLGTQLRAAPDGHNLRLLWATTSSGDGLGTGPGSWHPDDPQATAAAANE